MRALRDRTCRRATAALRWAAVGCLGLAAAGVLAVQTVPELVLYRERLVLNILELDSDVDLQPLDVATRDGLVLRSWYHAPAPGRPVIVYFPGRVGDLVNKPSHLFRLAEEGYGLVLAGYRGYGGNPGRPSERRLYADAADLMVRLSEDQLAPAGIVLYGYSMGTGVASYVASQSTPKGLILEAPFTSFADLVHNTARQVPIWLVRTRFDTGSRFDEIHAPILLLAGRKDRITPAVFAERLATMNAGFASLHVFPEGTHGTLIENGAWETITGFLIDMVEPAVAPLLEAVDRADDQLPAELLPADQDSADKPPLP